jgi:DNA-directed RNA polymerase subunit RPC12/RpoP
MIMEQYDEWDEWLCIGCGYDFLACLEDDEVLPECPRCGSSISVEPDTTSRGQES